VKQPVAEKAEPVVPTGPVGTRELLEAWPAVLEKIQAKSRAAWLVVVSAQVRSLEDDVLTLVFSNEADAASFRPQKGIPGGVHEILRQAIIDTLGVRVAFKVSSDTSATAPIDRVTSTGAVPVADAPVNAPREFATPLAEEEPPLPEEPPADLDDEPPYEERVAPAAPAAPAAAKAAPAPAPAAAAPAAVEDDGWEVVAIPGSDGPAVLEDETVAEEVVDVAVVDEPVAAPAKKLTPEQAAHEEARYGEAVVRELLDAKFIAEEVTAPIAVVADDVTPED
jgi:DNA polymerase-3 subunit gamma/tau